MVKRLACNSLLWLFCLIILNRPEGTEIAVDTRQISVIEAVETRHHYVTGTKAIVHVGGGERIAVRQTPDEVLHLANSCETVIEHGGR